jgi:hypothetical protein
MMDRILAVPHYSAMLVVTLAGGRVTITYSRQGGDNIERCVESLSISD